MAGGAGAAPAQNAGSAGTGAQQPPTTAGGWTEAGTAHAAANRLGEAALAFEKAVALAEAGDGGTAALVVALRELALARLRQQRVADAAALVERALPLSERELSGTRPHGLVLLAAGIVALTREDFAAAQQHSRAAIDILSREDPDNLEIIRAFQALGTAQERVGDGDGAHETLQRALATARARAPGTMHEAAALNNLGLNAKNRGDLEAAERYYLDALPVIEGDNPTNLNAAIVLGNLGVVADLRGDLDRAESYQRRALAIREKLDPEGQSVFMTLNNLGIIATKRKDRQQAEQHLRRALAIVERLAPDTLSHADALGNLAIALEDDAEPLAEARTLQERALAIRERHAPGSLRVALSLAALAAVVERQGDLARAETLHRQALDIRERMAPGSTDEALSLHALGRLARTRGDLAAARDYFTRAVDAFEGQSRRLGGAPEVRSGFRAGHRPLYGDLIELLAAAGEHDAAFAAYERSRARVVRDLLAQREAAVEADVPRALRDERRRVDRDFDAVQAELAAAPAGDTATIERLHARLRDLRAAQVDIAAQVRAVSPRAADVEYPLFVTRSQAQAALDPGTLALAYSVGERQTVLFALSRTSFTTTVLPVGLERLREDVDRWRRLAGRGRTDPRAPQPLADASAALFDTLVGAAADAIGRHERLLVVADGPLHLLPFSALTRPAGDGPARQYLVESLPVHHIVSFTIAAQERARSASREHPAEPRLVSFGAPLYPAAATPAMDAAVRSFVERSSTLAALPGAQREVTELSRLFGDRGRAFVGADATEARARAVMPQADYVHLAVHGLLNETFPMNSALVFTIPDRPDAEANGLLQAWEVMDHLRLDAELVVLSACDTGVGASSGGDGLLGLSRAFLFAGARSVVASLWPIADDTTPRFMRSFYAELARGVPKDRALAAAQRTMLADPATAHPYFWAPFVLSGDWS